MSPKLFAPFELQYEITNILSREAHFLDNRRYEDWLDLLSDDIVYRMPMRVTTEKKDGSDILDEMAFFEETKKSLITRVQRLRTSSAWVENPPTRQRHLITNVLIELGEKPDEYEVTSSFLFLRSRASDLHIEQLSGERRDVLRLVDGKWQIAARTIYPDQAVLGVMNLSMFL